jgi:hypothetical protein
MISKRKFGCHTAKAAFDISDRLNFLMGIDMHGHVAMALPVMFS